MNGWLLQACLEAHAAAAEALATPKLADALRRLAGESVLGQEEQAELLAAPLAAAFFPRCGMPHSMQPLTLHHCKLIGICQVFASGSCLLAAAAASCSVSATWTVSHSLLSRFLQNLQCCRSRFAKATLQRGMEAVGRGEDACRPPVLLLLRELFRLPGAPRLPPPTALDAALLGPLAALLDGPHAPLALQVPVLLLLRCAVYKLWKAACCKTEFRKMLMISCVSAAMRPAIDAASSIYSCSTHVSCKWQVMEAMMQYCSSAQRQAKASATDPAHLSPSRGDTLRVSLHMQQADT